MLCRATSREAVEQLADGAVVQEDGAITALGTYEDLSRRYRDMPVIGFGQDILLPGFVNAHHHVGLTPLQLGSPDMPLELWWITRMICRSVNPYLDTLYGAFDMIGSGITTVQHIHGWVPGTATEVAAASEQVLRAYDDVGMRVSYCYAVREQNRLVYQDDATFVASLPDALRGPMQRWFDRFRMSLDDMLGLFESLHAKHSARRRTRIQLAPANLHWCSDHALDRLGQCAERHRVRLHIHLLETAFQKRLVLRAHRTPGMDEADVPTVPQVFRMATAGGAQTTDFAGTIGEIAPGQAADLVLLDWDHIAGPYIDAETSLADAVIQRGKRGGVRTVLCDGEVIYDEGRITKVDQGAALVALHDELQRALSHDEMERRALSRALLPHVRAFYRGYIDPARHDPFYRMSAKT